MNLQVRRQAKLLGAQLRARRMECGISLSELARASGISKGECSKVENGKANVTLGTLKAMGAALALQLRVEIQEVVR